MKEICLTPAPWAWIPLMIIGGYVATQALLRFAERRRHGWGVIVCMLGLVLTVIAAYPFFLSWASR